MNNLECVQISGSARTLTSFFDVLRPVQPVPEHPGTPKNMTGTAETHVRPQSMKYLRFERICLSEPEKAMSINSWCHN